MCVLAGYIKHPSNLSLWQPAQLSLLSPLLWTSSFYPWMLLEVRIDVPLLPHQWIVPKSVTEVCKATLRELGESAPFISLKEDGKFLFYSWLSFLLLCFAGLSERFSCLHRLKWTAGGQTMEGTSAVCYNNGQSIPLRGTALIVWHQTQPKHDGWMGDEWGSLVMSTLPFWCQEVEGCFDRFEGHRLNVYLFLGFWLCLVWFWEKIWNGYCSFQLLWLPFLPKDTCHLWSWQQTFRLGRGL